MEKTYGNWRGKSIRLYKEKIIPEEDTVISKTQVGTATVLHPSGRLDHASAAAFESDLLSELHSSAGLVIDLSDVPYVSSVGLRVLMLGAKECKAANRTLAVSNLQPIVQEIFQISRFHFVTPIFATTEEALAKLNPQG